MKRLFFGLAPDLQALAQCLDVMAAIGPRAKLVSASNLHVTLLFLGAIDADQEAALLAQAGRIAFPSFTQNFDALSYWRKPQLLCLTASHSDDALQDLAARLKTVAENLGIAVDNRPYLPHVTLARKARLAVARHIEPVIWRAERFYLFESVATDDGVSYRKLDSWAATA